MRLRSFIIIGALLLGIGVVLYLFQKAAKPQTFIVGAYETAVAWTDGPDVELNPDSLKKLNNEIADFVRPQLHGMNPFRVTSLRKRQVEVTAMVAEVPSSELNTKVVAFVQSRLGKIASQQ